VSLSHVFTISVYFTLLTVGHASATSLAPVKWRIQFKLASLTYKVLHTGTPSYLSERLHPYVLSHTLQSSSSADLYVHHTTGNLHFGSRSFHTAAPTVWNSLRFTLHSSQTINTIRKHLKTHLFQSAFNSP